jgi:hypothetical protein
MAAATDRLAVVPVARKFTDPPSLIRKPAGPGAHQGADNAGPRVRNGSETSSEVGGTGRTEHSTATRLQPAEARLMLDPALHPVNTSRSFSAARGGGRQAVGSVESTRRFANSAPALEDTRRGFGILVPRYR